MAYTPTLYERETIIRWDDESAEATFYTVSPIWMRKMDKLVEQYPDAFRMTGSEKMDGAICSKTYELPKRFIKVRPPRVMSEKQKEVFEKMQRMNSVSK